MQLLLDRTSTSPLHRQIASQIRSLIESGDLAVGSRLPATRGLARTLGVNRATVCAAYDALASAGYVEPRVGRGTRVVRSSIASRPPARPAGAARVEPAPGPGPDWSGLLASALDPRWPHLEPPAAPGGRHPGRIDFTGLIPDESFFPVDRLRRCLDVVLRRDGARLLQYGSARGYTRFREVLAQRMRLCGTAVCADDILIVNGAQQGLDLFCKALLDPGDAVVVESPTYGNLLPLLRLYRADILAVPMTPQGLDLEQLESVLGRRRVKFLYTMPHFQNPTGVTTGLEHRKLLLELAGRYDAAILEDGFEADLRWDGGEVLPLRALDPNGRVSYLGTFSKGLCPGFRLGWLVTGQRLVAHLAHLKRTTDFHTSVLLQAALAEFCERGEYDTHLRRLRRIYRARMAAAASALEAHVPRSVRWHVPQGGYCIWLELPAGISDDELTARAARDAVRLASGRHFFTNDPGYGCLRLSISRVDEEQIEKGIAVVGRHLEQLGREAVQDDVATDARPYI
ncbi:MAG: PLP-dependent aminotransferase family protein [Candidatus Krumholzibacteriia bacterium]